MAIDTAAKRASMLGFGGGDLLPVPDGTIAVADRLTLLTLYGGIEPEEVFTTSPRYRPSAATAPRGIRLSMTAMPSSPRPRMAAGADAYRPGNPSTPSG